MIFHVEERGGDLVGWVLPDDPASTPSVVVTLDRGRTATRLVADGERPDLAIGGFHRSGRCGFAVTAATCPGYGPDRPVEIREAGSNLLIYRRTARAAAAVSLYCLETQTFPVYRPGRFLADQVRMVYADVERLEARTRTYLARLPADSILISGSAPYPGMRPHLGPRFRRCVLFCDPLREVASRLLLARALGQAGEADGWRMLGLGALGAAVAGTDLADPEALRDALGRMPDEVFGALANPATRALAAAPRGDAPGRRHLGDAVEALAEFDVIGFENDLGSYREELGLMLGLDVFGPDREADPPGLPGVVDALGSVAAAQELVDLDRALVAIARSASGTADAAALGTPA